MKTHNLVPVAVTLGGKKIGEPAVLTYLPDDVRFDPNFPDEPERINTLPNISALRKDDPDFYRRLAWLDRDFRRRLNDELADLAEAWSTGMKF